MASRTALQQALKTLRTQWPDFTDDDAAVVLAPFKEGGRHGSTSDSEIDEAVQHYLDTQRFKPRRNDLLEALDNMREATIEREALQWEARQAEQRDKLDAIEREGAAKGDTEAVAALVGKGTLTHRDQQALQGQHEHWKTKAEARRKRSKCYDCEGSGLAYFWYDPKNTRRVWTRAQFYALGFDQGAALRCSQAVCDCAAGSATPYARQYAPEFYSQSQRRTIHDAPLWPQLYIIRRLEKQRLRDQQTELIAADFAPTRRSAAQTQPNSSIDTPSSASATEALTGALDTGGI